MDKLLQLADIIENLSNIQKSVDQNIDSLKEILRLLEKASEFLNSINHDHKDEIQQAIKVIEKYFGDHFDEASIILSLTKGMEKPKKAEKKPRKKPGKKGSKKADIPDIKGLKFKTREELLQILSSFTKPQIKSIGEALSIRIKEQNKDDMIHELITEIYQPKELAKLANLEEKK